MTNLFYHFDAKKLKPVSSYQSIARGYAQTCLNEVKSPLYIKSRVTSQTNLDKKRSKTRTSLYMHELSHFCSFNQDAVLSCIGLNSSQAQEAILHQGFSMRLKIDLDPLFGLFESYIEFGKALRHFLIVTAPPKILILSIFGAERRRHGHIERRWKER